MLMAECVIVTVCWIDDEYRAADDEHPMIKNHMSKETKIQRRGVKLPKVLRVEGKTQNIMSSEPSRG